jgi:uroporphyrin-3 C-methyltransferase
MYQELSSTRDERVLAEVEQAVVIAMQQLQFAGNVEAALLRLQGADARLARSAQPQFLPVRSADCA